MVTIILLRLRMELVNAHRIDLAVVRPRHTARRLDAPEGL